MTIVEMSVSMDGPGSEKKIRKAINKLEGVDHVDIDMEKQKVTVMGYVDPEEVLSVVDKANASFFTCTGTPPPAILWPYPHNAEYYQHQQQYQIDNVPHIYGYYQTPAEEKAFTLFSDENVHACTIM